MLGEILEHLLEAKLQVESSPAEVSFVVFYKSPLLDFIHNLSMILIINMDSNLVVGLVKRNKGLVWSINLVIITELSKVSCSEFISLSSVAHNRLYSRELIDNSLEPLWIILIQEFFGLFVIELQWVSTLFEVFQSLLTKRGKSVDVVVIAMILLSSRVFNGTLKALSESMLIRHGNA